jgi:hypothetical protein
MFSIKMFYSRPALAAGSVERRAILCFAASGGERCCVNFSGEDILLPYCTEVNANTKPGGKCSSQLFFDQGIKGKVSCYWL